MDGLPLNIVMKQISFSHEDADTLNSSEIIYDVIGHCWWTL